MQSPSARLTLRQGIRPGHRESGRGRRAAAGGAAGRERGAARRRVCARAGLAAAPAQVGHRRHRLLRRPQGRLPHSCSALARGCLRPVARGRARLISSRGFALGPPLHVCQSVSAGIMSLSKDRAQHGLPHPGYALAWGAVRVVAHSMTTPNPAVLWRGPALVRQRCDSRTRAFTAVGGRARRRRSWAWRARTRTTSRPTPRSTPATAEARSSTLPARWALCNRHPTFCLQQLGLCEHTCVGMG